MAGVSYIPSASGALRAFKQWLGEQYSRDELQTATLLVPNHRIVRELTALWGEEKKLPPRMIPLGNVTHTQCLRMLHPLKGAAEAILAIPRAVPKEMLTHHMVRCIVAYQKKRDGHAHLERALSLSEDLLELLELCDEAGINPNDVAFDTLALTKESYARHWYHAAEFLGIITTYLPQIMQELGAITSAAQQRLLVGCMADYAAQLRAPCVLLGSSGSVPYVRNLMAALANAPAGHVILPGMPPSAEQASEGRQGFFLQQSLDAMGKAATAIPTVKKSGVKRALLCANEEEEARVIAVMMQQSASQCGKVTMLVTRDIGLMRRVSALLACVGMVADSPSITREADTEIGGFISGFAQLIANKQALMVWHAWLFHPWVGAQDTDFATWRHQVDKKAFRGTSRFKPSALHHVSPVGAALEHWYSQHLPRMKPIQTLDAWLAHLLRVAELAGVSDTNQRRLKEWTDELKDIGGLYAPMTASELSALLQHRLAARQAVASQPTHPNIRMLTPVEARFMHADRVIFGAFHEGGWGAGPASNWLNDAQLKTLGLLGRAANQSLTRHDIAMHAEAAECYFTRAQMVNHSPTTPYAAAHFYVNSWERESEWHHVANATRSHAYTPIKAALPCPPANARPQSLPVKALEMAQQNPYQIYAEYVLGIKALDAYGSKPESMAFGIVAHKLMEQLASGGTWGEAMRSQLLQRYDIGQAEGVFWQARMESIAAFAAAWLPEHMHGVNARPEHTIEQAIALNNGSVMLLNGRIDAWFGEALIDYKTGGLPKAKEVEQGIYCQLTAYGMMVKQQTGDWPSSITYVRLPDVKRNAEYTHIAWDSAAWKAHEEALKGLMQRIQSSEIPFATRPYGLAANAYDAVDGVSRALEVQLANG